MKLYPHNQTAYDEAKRRFKTSDRTCIIHPTGTGKSLIIAKFIQDNPRKNHLVLAPSRYIKEEIKKHTKRDFHFSTYIGLLDYLDYEENEDKDIYSIYFDYIYLDEFHRIGADVWGYFTKQFLSDNAQAKILGTSATPIRYLDDHRNMASEIFQDNIASNISLNQAIKSGILPAPKYVAALYSIDMEYARLARKILASKNKNKTILIDALKRGAVDWERSGGLNAVFKKHLTLNRNRIIVFCRNRKHMKEAEKIITPALLKKFKSLESSHIYSEFGIRKNRVALEGFSSGNGAKVLYTVNMVNEGLHVKGVNTVILLRQTVSPTVFYQQLGRAFSAAEQKSPLIFDLVNNFNLIRIREFNQEYEEEAPVGSDQLEKFIHNPLKIAVKFIDETKDIQDLFRAFSNAIENWEMMYAEAKNYYNENGHLYVTSSENYDLYRWIINQRHNRKAGHMISEKIERLNNIGIDWHHSNESIWHKKYGEIKEFTEKHGTLPVPATDKRLYSWLYIQRKKYKSGDIEDGKALLLNKIGALEKKGSRQKKWEGIIKEMKKYKGKKGSFVFTKEDSLYNKANYIKKAYQSGSFPDFALKELAAMGFPFIRKSRTWEESAKMVADYKKKHKRLPSPECDKKLYRWMVGERSLYRQGKLKDLDKIKVLRQIGIIDK